MTAPRARLIHCLALLVASPATLLGADQSNIPSPGAPAAGDSGQAGDLPVLEVPGKRVSDYGEDDLVGSYGQPRWSTTRRFAEVRMYVLPAGQLDFEYWLFIDTPTRQQLHEAKQGGPPTTTQLTQQYEVEMGLGYHFQTDIYQVYIKNGSNNQTIMDSTKFEVRYALADWDKIWANPTLYAEWIENAHGADNAEFKLLLGDQLAPGWFWATNLVFQTETGNEMEHSHEWNTGVSYDLIDRKLSIGAEDHIGFVTDRDPDGNGGWLHSTNHHWEILAGPSLRAYPVPRAHIDLTVFAGLTTRTSSTETVLIAGWEF
jgi:hypothetical protein